MSEEISTEEIEIEEGNSSTATAPAGSEMAEADTRAAVDSREQNYIDALLHERAGYLRMGKKDRAKSVDEQLALRGYSAPPVTPEDAPTKAKGQRTAKA